MAEAQPQTAAPAASPSPQPTFPPKSGSSSPTRAAGASPDVHLEADDNLDETDSLADSESLHSETTSLASSIAKYRHENGRTYHAYKDGAYIMPNDDIENERLDLQHNLFSLTYDGKLHICPAGRDKPLHRVLDCGTGTGLWAMDFADEHPETEVLGVDLSPIQSSFVPPNLSFLVDDLESPWTYGTKFDFIYARMLTGSLANWKYFTEQSFENLNPGGWLEFTDMGFISCDDGTFPEGTAVQKWTDHLVEAADRIGRPMDGVKSHKKHLEEAGFINVTEVQFKWPTNRWPKDLKFKEIGVWTNENMGGGLSAITLALFTRVLGWTADEVEVFVANVRKDIRNPAYHCYWPIIVIYGQKPESSTTA